MQFKNLCELVKSDFLMVTKANKLTTKIYVVLFSRGFHCVLLIRISQYFTNKKLLNVLAVFFQNIVAAFYGCYVSCRSIIGPGLELPHPIGIVIGIGSKIGANVCIYQGVTIGAKKDNKNEINYPTLDDGVIVYPNSVIIGSVNVGKSSVVGAGAVVLSSIPDNCVGVGVPAKHFKK